MDDDKIHNRFEQDEDTLVRRRNAENGAERKERCWTAREILRTMREVRSSLRNGGPPLDFEMLVDYVDGELDDDETAAQIDRNIVTWKEWHDAFWDLVHANCAAEIDQQNH